MSAQRVTFYKEKNLLKSEFQRFSSFSKLILNYGLPSVHSFNKRKWRSFRRRVEEDGTSPVKFNHNFKVSHSLPPVPECRVDETAVQERTQVFCAVIDQNYDTHTYIDKTWLMRWSGFFNDFSAQSSGIYMEPYGLWGSQMCHVYYLSKCLPINCSVVIVIQYFQRAELSAAWLYKQKSILWIAA